MTASDLINCIKSMTPAEKTQLGQALSDIGVSVVITKRLGTTRQSITGISLDPGETKYGKGEAYDLPPTDGKQ